MRTEKEMFDMILEFAQKEDRIRAVGMEGSRTNPNVPRDIFQDYDISFIVNEMNSFISDENWIDIFGKRILFQKPEAMSLFPSELGSWYSYLMLFEDGNRIDLTLIPVEEKTLYIEEDKLLKILLDKDNIFPKLPEPSDENYHVKKPSQEFLKDNCNEFFWLSTYVAKGLWRKEILYAIDHLVLMRSCLLRALAWKAGISMNFSKSVGKNYKYIDKFISGEEWNSLLKTYKNSNYEDCWNSLFSMINLFRKTSKFIANEFGYSYSIEEDMNAVNYLDKIRKMPEKSTEN